MRILVHGLAGDKLGGIETYVLNMERFISKDLVFDYVLETGREENRYISGKGDLCYISPKRNMIGNIRDWNRLLKNRKGLDSAVYFNMYSLAWLFPIFLAKAHGYKVILHAHNSNLHDCSVAQRVAHAFGRLVTKHLKVIRLTNSCLSSKFFFGTKPAVMVYNAIDTERFSYDAEKRIKMRNSLALEGRNVYGFSGRIANSKNPFFLIDIFKEIAKSDNNAAFLVCGDGNLMDEVQVLAKSYSLDIRFVGSVQNVEDYYQAMDCLLLPSKAEGLGIVLIEAQCAGLPCLSSAEVIPEIAKVTSLLHFYPLENGADCWAEEAVHMIQANQSERGKYHSLLAETRYNIASEAKRLEEILLAYVSPETGKRE